MPGKVMDGRVVARTVRSKIAERVKALNAANVRPNLVTILVGDNPASKTYLRNKHQACLDASMESRNVELPTDTPQAKIIDLIHDLNRDSTGPGILLQLPLPKGLDETEAVSTIAPEKEGEGLNPS